MESKIMEHWYAVYTRPRHEKKVFEQFQEREQESYLPLVKQVRLWKDRKKKVEVPMFRSYLFARFDYKYRFDLLQIKGVVKIVNFRGTPAVVPDWQIDALKKMVENPDKVHFETYIHTGEEVEVTEGAFKGMRGMVKTIKGATRLVVTIEGILQSVSVDIDTGFIKRITENKK